MTPGRNDFDDDVGIDCELVRCEPILFLCQVEDDAAFVAIDAIEVDANTFIDRRIELRIVSNLGLLDLNYVRAEIPERLRAPRPGEQPTEINHTHAVQREI